MIEDPASNHSTGIMSTHLIEDPASYQSTIKFFFFFFWLNTSCNHSLPCVHEEMVTCINSVSD